MSYYTYFKPTKDKYNPTNLSSDNINKNIKEVSERIKEYTLSLKVCMVDAYYQGTMKCMPHLRAFFNILSSYYKTKVSYENILWIEGELGEFGSVGINHADCPAKDYLEESIEEDNNLIDKALEELLILASIKPFYGKEDSDEESSYLRNEYQRNIDGILEEMESNINELAKDQFMLDYFDTKKTEADLAKEKNKETK